MSSNYNRARAHQNEIALLRKELARRERARHGRMISSITGVFYRPPNWDAIAKIASMLLPAIQKVSKIKACFSKITINKKGTPDDRFDISVKGIPIFFYIETKTGDAVQTPEQKEFEQKCNLLGWIYIINRDYMVTADIICNYIEQLAARIK